MQQLTNPRLDQFMAITGCDGSEAEYYLSQNHNILENALHDFYEDPTKAHKNIKKTTLLNQFKEFKNQEQKRNCIVRSIDIKGRSLLNNVKILWKQIVPTIIRGTTPGEEFLLEIGGQMKNFYFQQGTFDQAIKTSYEADRPLLLLVYTQELKGRLNQLLNEDVSTYIGDNFIALGLLSESEQLLQSLKQQSVQKPSINIFRINFINEVHLMSELDLKPQTTPEDIISFLSRSSESVKEQQTLETTIKRQVLQEDYHRNRVSHEDVLIEPEESGDILVDYQTDRQIKRQQEEQLQLMIAQHQRKKSEQIEQALEQKRNQQKLQMLQQDRKARKLSLPQEPRIGNIITINFKLPMGGRLLRSFDKNDKIQLIFNFIELQEKIQFQNEVDRKFDVLTMNPGMSLSDKRSLTMLQVFSDQEQEVLLVKQL